MPGLLARRSDARIAVDATGQTTRNRGEKISRDLGYLPRVATLRPHESRCGEVGSERTSRHFGLLIIPLRLLSLSSSFFSFRMTLSRLFLSVRTARQIRSLKAAFPASAIGEKRHITDSRSIAAAVLLVYLVRTLVSNDLSLFLLSSLSLPTARLKSI